MQQQQKNQRLSDRFLRRVSLLLLGGVLGWSGVGYSGGPNFNATVSSQGSSPTFQLTDTTAGEANWRLRADSPVNEAFSIRWSDNESSAAPLVIENGAPNNAVYVDEYGRVGLGTSTPARDLQIVNDHPGIRLMETDEPGQPRWDVRVKDGNFEILDLTQIRVPLSIEPGGSGVDVRIAANGNLGVGVFSPQEAVDVRRYVSASRFQLTSISDNPADAPQFIQRRARGESDFVDPVESGDNLGLFSFRGRLPNGNFSGSQATITAQTTQDWTNSARGTRLLFGTTPNGSSTVSTVMEITHDGRVLINGAQLSVPDYVFAEDYELMPLEELEAYIREHKHLPEVASEAEVKAGGVDLTGTQMALLKKVEELTLYTLQQQKQLAALEAHNTTLRQHNAELVDKDRALEQRLAALEQQLTSVSR